MHIENMSLRAYKVENGEVKQYPSFNCWYDGDFFNFLLRGKGTLDYTTPLEGAGTFVVPVKRVREALDDAALRLSPRTREAVIKDIEWADDNLQEAIEYECA